MSSPSDLTRWNRAGLSRFRYVDGNAATYLETLRQALARRFPAWEDLALAVPVTETDAQRLDRLLVQYFEEEPSGATAARSREAVSRLRRDPAWQITRAAARAVHVLGEYLDAYANEGFLRTATQWDNVRRLVEMLDVHPAPPASAATVLVLAAKGLPGPVERGLQVQGTPPDGGPPVVFETLEDAEVDPALNAVRLAGWNRSVETLGAAARTARPVDLRPALAVEGVGPVIASQLDGFAGKPFTLADFAALDPARDAVGAPAPVSKVRLWEFKSKAEALLGFPWYEAEIGALRSFALPEIVARTPRELAGLAGRTVEEMERLQGDVRLAEIALDEPVFAAMLLGELLAAGERPSPLWLAADTSKISAGQLALLVRDGNPDEGAAVAIGGVEPETRGILLEEVAFQPIWQAWLKADTRLLARPELIEKPRLNGSQVASFAEAHNLVAGEVVAWTVGGAWSFATVREADERAVRLEGGLPAPGREIFHALRVERIPEGLFLPLQPKAAAIPSAGGGTPIVLATATEIVTDANHVNRIRRVLDNQLSAILYVPEFPSAAGTIAAAPFAEFLFDGKPGKLAGGQWVIADDGERLHALVVDRVTEKEDYFAVTLRDPAEPQQPVPPPPLPPVGGRPATDIMGVDAVYGRLLAKVNIGTIGALARLDLTSPPAGISRTLLWELKTKATLAVSFDGDRAQLAPILGDPVWSVLQISTADLAARLKQPAADVEALQQKLRLLEAVIDEPAFRTADASPGPVIMMRDLFPEGSAASQPVIAQLVRLYGLFAETLRPEGYDRNGTAVTGTSFQLDLLSLGGALPTLLARGRSLVLERQEGGGFSGARKAKVDAVTAQSAKIEISPAVEAGEGFTFANLVLRGNLATAGHGEGKPEKVLGSGDATRSNPSFVLAQKGVSFVADATQPSGVRADIDVKVESQIWEQKAALNDSRPTDPHYTVRVTEEGQLAIAFGDGRTGRRLPTGANNVRVHFRVGSGLAGNLASGTLSKLKKPHRRVEAVRQPFAATGGNDQEPVDSLRENAPASVLTLERAVSLTDFTHLAARQSSVWQARAFALPAAGRRRGAIEVVVVPAGGGVLGDLGVTLRDFLQAHALPGVEVAVSLYRSVPFQLAADVRVVKSQFDLAEVAERVRAVLLDAFSLRRRGLGQDLFLSEVVRAVEEVAGVSYSTSVLNGDPALRRLAAQDQEVIHIDAAASSLSVAAQEVEL